MAEGCLHSSSTASAASSAASTDSAAISAAGTSSSGGSNDGGSGRHKPPPHRLTTTSIKQKMDLERLVHGGRKSPQQEQNWIDVYSLEALKLTLDHIMHHCKLPRQRIVVEFPFSQYLSVLNTANRKPPPSPSRPETNLDKKKLAAKMKEVKLLIKFYKNRIRWLSTDSREAFGLLLGSKVAVVVEASQCLAEMGQGNVFRQGNVFQQYKAALKMLVDEQLVTKSMVYLIKYGNSASPTKPQGLPFTKFKAECVKCATDWVTSLEGKGGANLLEALKLALEIPDLDTICVILSTMPNQPLDIISNFMVDKLGGEDAPKLHLVAASASGDIQRSLSDLSRECNGHFHSHTWQALCGPGGEGGSSRTEDSSSSVRDSGIDRIREEVVKARKILSELKNLEHGNLDQQLLDTLRELSLTVDWEEDDDFPYEAPPTGDHCEVCSTRHWLLKHGIESQKLNLYRCLGPNAYPQLDGYVKITDHYVVSHVYDVMPLIPWEDGSVKYLHVDVHGLEAYLSTLEHFIMDSLHTRLSWLHCGSRVPFGVLLESAVLLVVDSSHSILGRILTLQQHFKLLIGEQLAHVQEFNLMGCGRECRMWTSGFAEPNRQSLAQAWEWILGISPSGSNDLLSALKVIFESGSIFENCTEGDYEIDDTGIYLVMCSLPNQPLDVLCSYMEQVTAGHGIGIHMIYYDTEPLTDPSLYAGSEGGRFGSGGEVKGCLQALAAAGRGRYHHFKVRGTCEGDEITQLMEEIAQATEYLEEGRRILEDYREFCRRNIREPMMNLEASSPEDRHTPAPPLYPRQTTSSLARMNACSCKVDPAEAKQDNRRRRKQMYYMKDHFFYTGRGLNKARAWDLVTDISPKKVKPKPLIPAREEHISSEEWVCQYGIEALQLEFSRFILKSDADNAIGSKFGRYKPKRTKHINHQGEVTELSVDTKGLKECATKLQKVLKRYQDRVQWLNRDENKYFGSILEREVLFLLDVSMSMSNHLHEIREGLALQLAKLPAKTKRFNLIAFSSTVKLWREDMVSVNKEAIDDALQWLHTIRAGGNSYLLQALKVSLESGAKGVYLITDGAADHTHEFLLNQLPSLGSRYAHPWKIHAIGWRCSDRANRLAAMRDSDERITAIFTPFLRGPLRFTSQRFLEGLAHGSGGRFHSYPDTAQSDDRGIMTTEISSAKLSLKQTNNYL